MRFAISLAEPRQWRCFVKSLLLRRFNTVVWYTVIAFIVFASSATSLAAVDLKGDPRLDVKVTLSMGKATLESVVQALAQKTGVPMFAGQRKEDWLVREMPVNVFVKDVPAWQVMEHLAKLTDFTWSAVGEGEDKGYRIWQDLKARQQQAEEKEKRLKALQAERTAKGIQNIEAFAKLSRLSQKELEELAKDDPVAFFIATQPGFNAIPAIAAALNQEQRLKATTPEGIKIPYGEMSPQLQEAVRNMVRGMNSLLEKLSQQTQPLTSQEPDWEKTSLVIKAPSFESLMMMGGQMAVTGEINITSQTESVPITMSFPIFNTKSPFGKLIGKAFSQIAEGAPLVNIQVMMQEEFTKMVAQGFETEQKPPSDPELLKTVKWETKGWSSLDKELKAFHEASGLNLVADGLPQPSMQGPSLAASMGQEAKVYEILNRFKNLYGLDWEKFDSVIRMRDREWAKKRDWLIPQEKLSRWKAKAKTEEGLRIEDLIEMASLTEDQVKYGLMAEPEFLVLPLVLDERHRYLLNFLGSLSPDQMRRLENGEELPFGSLTTQQADLLQKMWTAANKLQGQDAKPIPTEASMKARTIPPGGQSSTQKQSLLKQEMVIFEFEWPDPNSPSGRAKHTFALAIPKLPPLPGMEEFDKEQKPQPQQTPQKQG
jgi:hypothetical protein